MTSELFYLLLTAILTGVLWIPVVIGYVTSRGLLTPQDYKVAPTSDLPDWINRANRAQLNAVENFGQFSAVVLIAHLADVHTGVTVFCASAYFYIRVIHAVLHISGFSYFNSRTVAFTLSFAAFLVYALEVLRNAI